MARNLITPYGPNMGTGVTPSSMATQPSPGMGIGQVFQRLRQKPPTGMDYMNQPFGAGETEAIPGQNVPMPQRQPIQRNVPMSITPGTMTDTEPAAQQIMELDEQMNQNFGMGSGPLGQPMQEFPGRPMDPMELDDLMQQLREEMQQDIVGNASPQDRVFKTSASLGRYKPSSVRGAM